MGCLISSLESLTEALQLLTEEERRTDRKPIILPQSIPTSAFLVHPDVEIFLNERELYQKATLYVNVGRY